MTELLIGTKVGPRPPLKDVWPDMVRYVGSHCRVYFPPLEDVAREAGVAANSVTRASALQHGWSRAQLAERLYGVPVMITRGYVSQYVGPVEMVEAVPVREPSFLDAKPPQTCAEVAAIADEVAAMWGLDAARTLGRFLIERTQ